jgi:hypothetical protein
VNDGELRIRDLCSVNLGEDAAIGIGSDKPRLAIRNLNWLTRERAHYQENL